MVTLLLLLTLAAGQDRTTPDWVQNLDRDAAEANSEEARARDAALAAGDGDLMPSETAACLQAGRAREALIAVAEREIAARVLLTRFINQAGEEPGPELLQAEALLADQTDLSLADFNLQMTQARQCSVAP